MDLLGEPIINIVKNRNKQIIPHPIPDNYNIKIDRKRKVLYTFPEIEPPFDTSSLEKFLEIAWYYSGSSFNWFKLWKLIPALEELNNMVGIPQLKKEIIDFILYHIQDLNSSRDMLHCVLYGSPGSGKTTLAGILAKLYCGLDFLSSEKITHIRRTDLIGKYVGHTESKTEEILQSAVGGVIFIDEAYSLGEGDIFSKTAIDIINRFLGEHAHDTICIIAGYEKDLQENFFSQNQGLERRFPWKFHIGKYLPAELEDMFRRKVKKSGWKIQMDEKGLEDFFNKYKDDFKFFGGDIDTLFSMCKIVHSKRIFGTSKERKLLVLKDFEQAITLFKSKRTLENDAYKSMFS